MNQIKPTNKIKKQIDHQHMTEQNKNAKIVSTDLAVCGTVSRALFCSKTMGRSYSSDLLNVKGANDIGFGDRTHWSGFAFNGRLKVRLYPFSRWKMSYFALALLEIRTCDENVRV